MLQIKTCDNKICNKMSNSNYTNYVMSFKTCQLSGADNTKVEVKSTHWAKKRNNWVNITKSDSLHLRNLEVGIEGLFSVTDSQRIPLILRN